MTELITKKEALIKIRNEQIEVLCRNEIDSKLLFQMMVGVDPKEHEESRKKRAEIENIIKTRKNLVDVIDKMLTEGDKKK